MKLKEIKPGMVIHWKTEDEKVSLLEELERLGYIWYGTHRKPTEKIKSANLGHVIFVYNDNGWKNITTSNRVDGVTHEFSDLIIPEMSAEEVLQICSEICRSGPCDICPMGEEYCFSETESDKKKIIEICQQWKSDHEKKEPEIETVDICRIIEIKPDGRRRCVREEDIKSELPFGGDERQKVEEILKKYCMEHDGEYIAVHEVVSRVKAVE